jgi:hypothetical protein
MTATQPAPAPQRFGGTTAPPVTPELLTRYEKLAETPGLNPIVREAMVTLAKMLREFWKTPASKNPKQPHSSQTGFVVPLEPEEIGRMHPHVPWYQELDMWGQLMNALPTGTEERPETRTVKDANGKEVTQVVFRGVVVDEAAHELRNAAKHLLWYGYELTNDREPRTNDTLPPELQPKAAAKPEAKKG